MKILALLLLLMVSGCITATNQQGDQRQAAIVSCQSACRAALEGNQNLSAGPCLLDTIPGTDWVCDVAHSPRQAVDNLPENQCSAYRTGEARHFVEVDPACNAITAV